MAFNVGIGNFDAHAKNYSILIAGAQVRLSPLYDTVPVHLWPQYAKAYSMAIGEARVASQLGEKQWRLLAEQSQLDGEEVLSWVTPVLTSITDPYADFARDFGAQDPQLHQIKKYVRAIKTSLGGNKAPGAAFH